MIETPDRELPAVLAMALGRSPRSLDIDWVRAFAMARNERCGALAWLRSAAFIRQEAPTEIVDAWRREAMSAVSLSLFWQPVIARVIAVLGEADVHATVLKGLPLAVHLYGDPAARPCVDLDLFVPLAQRPVADAALRQAGLRWIQGRSPDESSYEASFGGRAATLEVHSALLDGRLTAHLPFTPPGSELVRIGPREVLAHVDDQLPAFLATHLAKHKMPPLLWFIDFATLWATLDRRHRQSAVAAASRTRTRRYLEWAILNAQRIEAAASGSDSAVRALGFSAGARRDRYYAARMAELAASPTDALRVWYAWAAPKIFRTRWPRIDRQSLLDLYKKISFRFRGTRQEYLLHPFSPQREKKPDRTIRIDDDEIAGFGREMQRFSRAFWMVVDGSSMSPTIPPGTPIRFSAPGCREFRVGDVVLARLVTGRCVVHRIVRVSQGEILLRGDANETVDPPITGDCIIALADQMIANGSPVAIRVPIKLRARRMHRATRGAYGRMAALALTAVRRKLGRAPDMQAR